MTEENKNDYVRLVCQMKMTGAIRKQLGAFLEGFYDIIPRRLISIFNEQELELLLSGTRMSHIQSEGGGVGFVYTVNCNVVELLLGNNYIKLNTSF